jgi:hypothetical protein
MLVHVSHYIGRQACGSGRTASVASARQGRGRLDVALAGRRPQEAEHADAEVRDGDQPVIIRDNERRRGLAYRAASPAGALFEFHDVLAMSWYSLRLPGGRAARSQEKLRGF